MKKILTTILALSLVLFIFAFPVSAEASDDGSGRVELNTLRFTYISSAATNIALDDGVVSVAGSMSGYTNVTNCYVTVFLQYREIGATSWSTLASFSGYGLRTCFANGSRNATHGYEYRAQAKFVAYANDGRTETAYGYSVVAQYP